MTEFVLNIKRTSEVCDKLYSVSRSLSLAFQKTEEIGRYFRRKQGMYEIGEILMESANCIEKLKLYTGEMSNILNDGIMSYVDCENRICDRYNEKI